MRQIHWSRALHGISTIGFLAVLAPPTSALAGEPERQVIGEVIEAQAGWADQASRSIWTRLVVERRVCDGKPCAGQLRLLVPGGRVGEIDQRVAGLRVPAPGEKIFLELAASHVHLRAVPLSAAELKLPPCR